MSYDNPVITQFYRSLLDLDGPSTPAVVEQALRLAVESTHAQVGYCELWDDRNEPEFVRMEGVGSIDTIQLRISRGIISKAIIEGVPLVTSSALGDVRFKDLESVRQHELRSVLCVPVIRDEVIGVLYFEGETGRFTAEHVRDIELFSRELAKVSNRIVARSRQGLDVLTTEFRLHLVEDALARHDHNVTAAAKELQVTRRTLYRIRRGRS